MRWSLVFACQTLIGTMLCLVVLVDGWWVFGAGLAQAMFARCVGQVCCLSTLLSRSGRRSLAELGVYQEADGVRDGCPVVIAAAVVLASGSWYG